MIEGSTRTTYQDLQGEDMNKHIDMDDNTHRNPVWVGTVEWESNKQTLPPDQKHILDSLYRTAV